MAQARLGAAASLVYILCVRQAALLSESQDYDIVEAFEGQRGTNEKCGDDGRGGAPVAHNATANVVLDSHYSLGM